MKMLKMAERYAARVCYLCAAIGALVVIRGGISGEVDMAAYGAFLTLIGFCGRTLLFAVDIYDHLRGIPLPAERELVQAGARLRSEAPELNPLDRHYRRAAAEQEIIAAAEALIKERGWS